jgi:hypothetical protein
MEVLQLISIILEAIIVLIGIAIALAKKAALGWGFALTFGIYVFYDLAQYMHWQTDQTVLRGLFFFATLSAFWAVWSVYKQK